MFSIRNEQIKALGQVALQSFEDDMVEHLKTFATKHFEILGDLGVRGVVQLGIARARKYGLTNRGPARFYIELMFMLGTDFDTDPQLSWAAEILREDSTDDQMSRADRLYDTAAEYVNATAGLEYEYAKKSLQRARHQRLEDLDAVGGNVNGILSLLRAVYPEKYDYVGDEAIRILIERAAHLATRLGASRSASIPLFAGLAFALGHGFASDPQFPWIGHTLNRDTTQDPNIRIERLHSKMATYLERALRYLE